MNQTSKTIGKLLKFSGPFRITILLSAVISAPLIAFRSVQTADNPVPSAFSVIVKAPVISVFRLPFTTRISGEPQ